MCASLPTLRQFVRTVAPRFLGSTNNSNYYNNSGSAGNAPTIGAISSRGKKIKERGPYDHDPDVMMETLVDGGDWTHAHEIEEGNLRRSADGDSNTAILDDGGITRMQTTQVTYSEGRGAKGY